MTARFFTEVIEGFGPEPKLLFGLSRSSMVGGAVGFDFIALAEAKHINSYPVAYGEYLASIAPPPEPEPEL